MDGSNRYGLVASFLSKFYKSGTGQDIREPLHTVTTSPGHFGEVRAFLIKYYGDCTGQDISESGAGQALWKCSLSTDTCSTGQSQSARTVCGRENAKYKHSGRSDRSAPVCVSEVKRWEAFFMAERQ